ncbi:MAG: transcriptional regulator [Bacteroidetes bacterium]|nr:transcriptional regulator [Bacteroidota bacterium]
MKDSVYLVKLGEKIMNLRKAKGLSQEELAERLDTKHTQIGRVERGETNSTINMLRKIAVELEVSIEELVKIK